MIADDLKSSEKTCLASLARVELEGLQREGINPTWEQIARINDLARKVERPQSRSIAATGRPVWLGEYLLWPLTIAAAEWYTWAFDGLGELDRLFALVYAHVNARSDVFGPLYDLGEARSTLKSFRRTLHCTLNEVAEAVAELMEVDPSMGADLIADDSDDDGFDEMVATLVAETGIEPDVWRHRVCLRYAITQIDACRARNDESATEWKTEYVKAEQALGLALMEIRRDV